MSLDLHLTTFAFPPLGDDFDVEDVVDMSVLSFVDHDDTPMTDDEIFKSLHDCLFNNYVELSIPHITIVERPPPPSSLTAKRVLYKPRSRKATQQKQRKATQPPVKRQRQRTRTKESRVTENENRKAKVAQHNAARIKCIDTEGCLRGRVRQWIASFATARGLPVDARVLSYLPLELRYIMWRSDIAMEAYKQLIGFSNVCEAINSMRSWW